MDTKEITTLLRSLADVYESDTNDDSKKLIFNMIMDKVKPNIVVEEEKIENPLTKSPVKAYEFTDSDVKKGYHVKNIVSLIKKIEENDKIKAYKDRLAKADPSYKDILSDIDKTRGEIIENHMKEFKYGDDMTEDILTAIPDNRDFRFPGGHTLEEILKGTTIINPMLDAKGMQG